MMKRRLITAIVGALCTISAYSQIKDIAEFKEKRIEFHSFQEPQEALATIEAELRLLRASRDSYPEELFLTLENSLVGEQLAFTSRQDLESDAVKKALERQAAENERFTKGRNLEHLSSDYLCSAANIKLLVIPSLPTTRKIAEAMAAKDLYLTATENDSRSCSALLGYATWMYFAPAIAGGGRNASYKKYLEAEAVAANSEDLFFVLVYKSQVLWAMKKKDEAAAALRQAHELFPGEVLTRKVMELNAQGDTLFQMD